MRRYVFYRLLAAVALVAFSIGVVMLMRIDFAPAPPPVTFTDLAAPLPAESEADLAAALPAIDELRHHRGSLLDGSLLESVAAPEPAHDNSYIDLLRREARRMDSLAADNEDICHYDSADRLRRDAAQLRQQARELSTPVVSFGSTTVNR